MTAAGLIQEARAILPELVGLRRDVHRHAEIGLSLPRTQRAVLTALEPLPVRTTTGAALTSVVAVLRGGRSTGRSVLLRADMDALPGTERTGLEFACRTGAMHACGHDLHVAMLVGAARLLAARREALAGDVVLMFQPGEEGCDGASAMIGEGVLDAAGTRVGAAFALHVESAKLSHGILATRGGPLMAGSVRFRVTVHGAGGHGGAPHLARDPIPAAAEMVGALQTRVTRAFDVADPVVVTVGVLQAGTNYNTIPEVAVIEGSVRAFSAATRDRAGEELAAVCRGIAAAHGLAVEIAVEDLYPATVNDRAETSFVLDVARGLFGEDRVQELAAPMTVSEDFSRVLEQVPGAMAFLGACPVGTDASTAPFNHAPEAFFDEAVLADGAALLACLALARLAPTGCARERS